MEIYKNWKLSFCCNWFKGEDFKIVSIDFMVFDESYISIFGLQIAKFIINISLNKL